MNVKENSFDRRANKRLDLALPISLPEHEGKIVNISATGVYFEVITKDMDAFFPGTVIPIQIDAVTSTAGLEEQKIMLKGNGLVVRNDIKDVTSSGNKLGVAMKFKNKLNILTDEM